MTKDVIAVRPDTAFKTCVSKLESYGVSALPVVDAERRVIGIVSEADLLAKERRRGRQNPPLGIDLEESGWQAKGRTAGDVMTAPAICIAPDASIPQAARLMHREAVKRLPVIDSRGALLGIVSRSDLLKTFTRSDETIRHDIVDSVITKALILDPDTVDVKVEKGVVSLSGELESRSLCRVLVEMVERVEGTVGVDSNLTWRLDDSKLRVEGPPGALHLAASER